MFEATATTFPSQQHDARGLCLDCNYPLAGLHARRCPECGRGFDPTDAESFNPGRPIPRWAARAVGPISWPVYGVAVAACAFMLWRARLPGLSYSWRTPVLWGFAGVATLWAVWPAVRRGVLRRYGWPPRTIKPMGRWHWVGPIAIAVMILSTALALPRKAALSLSRTAMDTLAKQVMADPRRPYANRWVGLYNASKIRAVNGGMRFTAVDDTTQFKAGFAYLPQVDPRHVAWKAYRYIGDGWWTWREEG